MVQGTSPERKYYLDSGKARKRGLIFEAWVDLIFSIPDKGLARRVDQKVCKDMAPRSWRYMVS